MAICGGLRCIASGARSSALWPEARSVIRMGMNYGPKPTRWRAWLSAGAGALSGHARGRLSDIIKGKLTTLGVAAPRPAGRQGVRGQRAGDEKPLAQPPGSDGRHATNPFRRPARGGSRRNIHPVSCRGAQKQPLRQLRAARHLYDGRFPGPYRLDARRCSPISRLSTRDISRADSPKHGATALWCETASRSALEQIAEAASEANFAAGDKDGRRFRSAGAGRGRVSGRPSRDRRSATGAPLHPMLIATGNSAI